MIKASDSSTRTIYIDSDLIVDRELSVGVPVGTGGNLPIRYRIFFPKFKRDGTVITRVDYISVSTAKVTTASWLYHQKKQQLGVGDDFITANY